jgi:5-carboxyvanillate decarboxylase
MHYRVIDRITKIGESKMDTTRRALITGAAAAAAGLKLGSAQAAYTTPIVADRFRRIAVEEAFAVPELLQAWRKVVEAGAPGEPGFTALMGALVTAPAGSHIVELLTDIGAGRIAAMDATGISAQVLSHTGPGVQIFEPTLATELAIVANDRLSDAVRAHPSRFAGLATIAPQAPAGAARELERSVTKLGLTGAIINSHTKGEYLDDPKFWEIFEAASSLNTSIYIHPRTPAPEMLGPYLPHALVGASWGFAAEAGLHALRLIFAGVFDHFPKLQIVLGHMGEAIPFWLQRLDDTHQLSHRIQTAGVKKLKRRPSDYFRENFHVATSGVTSHSALKLTHEEIGADRLLFAVDYPYASGSDAVESMDAAPLSTEDKNKIYHLNAEKLYGL